MPLNLENRKTIIFEENNKKYFDSFIGTNRTSTNEVRGDISKKGNEIVNALCTMIKLTRKELLCVFTEKECLMLTSIIKNTLYNCDISAKYFLNNLMDDYSLFEFKKNEEEIVKTIIEKIKPLTEFQCYTLFINAFEYLDNPEIGINKFFLCK
jgi:hypothetical protein